MVRLIPKHNFIHRHKVIVQENVVDPLCRSYGEEEETSHHVVAERGCLRYVEFFLETESFLYVENISLHNVDILQALYNVENVSLQYVEKRKLIMGF